MSDDCQDCGGKCCRYFCFEIDKPDDFEAFEDIRWYLCHEGVSVHIEENGDWFIAIENRCRNLGPDARCTIYDNRPLICRRYDTDGCDHTQGDYEFKQLFRRPEELEAYARATLGPERFDAARRGAYDKAARPPAKPAPAATKGAKPAAKTASAGAKRRPGPATR